MENLTREQLIKLLTSEANQVLFDEITTDGFLDLCVVVPTDQGDVDYMVTIKVDVDTAVRSEA